jgi:hypothetical protein
MSLSLLSFCLFTLDNNHYLLMCWANKEFEFIPLSLGLHWMTSIPIKAWLWIGMRIHVSINQQIMLDELADKGETSLPDYLKRGEDFLTMAIISNTSCQDTGRIEDYVEMTIPCYSDAMFRSHFRMTGTSFDVIFIYYVQNTWFFDSISWHSILSFRLSYSFHNLFLPDFKLSARVPRKSSRNAHLEHQNWFRNNFTFL